VHDVEHIAPAGDFGQGQGLPGHQTGPPVADEGLGREAAVAQLHEADPPGLGIALLLQAQ
jgi:hypothetical protein